MSLLRSFSVTCTYGLESSTPKCDEFRVKTGSCKVNAAWQDLVLLGESEPKEVGTLRFLSLVVPLRRLVDAVHTREDDRVVRVATTATSLEAEQESGNINKTQSTTTLNEPSSQGTGLGSGPRCQNTTLGDTDARTRFETASKQSHNPPLSKVNTSGSEEDSMEHQDDLTDFVPPTPHDSPLSGGHTPRSDEVRHNKVKSLEKKQRARTLGMNLFKISISRRKSLEKENVSKQGRNLKTMPMFEEGDINDDFDDINDMVDKAMKNVEGDTVNAGGAVNTGTTKVSVASASVTTVGVSISTVEPRTPPTTTTTAIKDEDLTIAQTLVKMRNERVAFRDVEESVRLTIILPTIILKDKGKGIIQEPKKPPKNLRKAQIQLDEELAKRMHEEEMVELERRQSEIATVEEASKVPINQELDDILTMIKANEQMASRI
nr:hypothetical protein [Tanacetum cinerariifolium]